MFGLRVTVQRHVAVQQITLIERKKKGKSFMEKFIAEAKALENELVAWRRHIHQNPETDMDVQNTAAFVKSKLEEMGYEASYLAKTGVTAIAGGKKPGKCFLLRADMDALPIIEETDVEFKSTNGSMHACGHDFHTAMLLGAAKLLKAHEDEIDGCVKFMFQPAEESLKGARAMVEAGILETPAVDAAAMFHVAAGTPLPTGFIVVPDGGTFSAASDWFEINIEGKGGHGAMPEVTVDPLNVMSHIHLALQAINSREISAGDSAVVTVGMMTGGTTSNVIPDTAVMQGTIRTFDEEVRKFICERIKDISENIAKTFRARAEVTITVGCPSVVCDGAVANDIRSSLTDVFGMEVLDLSLLGTQKMNGSEDFSYISQKIPAVMMLLSAGSADDGYDYPLHHPKAKFDEGALSQGAAAYAVAALGWLTKNN